jgi:hypothetical protein
MVGPIVPPQQHRRLTKWLLDEDLETTPNKHKHPWWQAVCLTGVDYFSTLGYQPGIAALAAGLLSPVATLILVVVTLFGALPVYRQVAKLSPRGEGSLAMLERLLPGWPSKLFILVLLGFVSTDFIITITLSAADATTHLIQNPLMPQALQGQAIPITLILIALLGAVFLKGFHEAMGIAVALVAIYLSLNLVVIGVGAYQIWLQPSLIGQWQSALTTSHSSPLSAIGLSALLFPKLALGLSGFETGVAVMPLIKGSPQDTEKRPTGRIRNTHRLLTTAAVIMSFFLLTSSFETVLLIPAEAFQPGGAANGRALAYLAHTYLGSLFGSAYDLSTIAILWFAGASAMAGLLNIVPRYLPRYGMAPDWARATRPLVIVFGAIAFIVTLIFKANVEAQGGAYATGVLVLMSSAALAVTLAAYRRSAKLSALAFTLITLIFFYTTIANVIERPDGIRIAACFIGVIIITSLVSRIWRSTELRVKKVTLNDLAQQFVTEALVPTNPSGDAFKQPTLEIIAHRKIKGDWQEYERKAREVCEDNHLPLDTPLLFLEIEVVDASVFSDTVRVRGVQVGNHRILRSRSSAVPNAIAAILLHLRDTSGTLPHIYFGWMEGNPLEFMMRFVLFGEGDIPVTTREVLRKAEPDHEKRPGVFVGG